jgi:hypothetical protein
MGRGLSTLQREILLEALETAPRHQEQEERRKALLASQGRPWEPYAGNQNHHRTCGIAIHRRVYGCYQEDNWRDPTPAQRVAVSKAFKRLQERGLVDERKCHTGAFLLTAEGLETAKTLLANRCP